MSYDNMNEPSDDYKPDFPERDHGYGRAPAVTEAPTATPFKGPEDAACPNCGCKAIHEIRQPVERPPLLRGKGPAVGTYLGCPACPWASPMVVVSA